MTYAVSEWKLRIRSQTRKGWRRSAQRRCASALAEAISASDRLTLLRERARLSDGYLDLQGNGITLAEDERREVARFGLTVSGAVLRTADHLSTALPSDVATAFELETRRPTLGIRMPACNRELRKFPGPADVGGCGFVLSGAPV